MRILFVLFLAGGLSAQSFEVISVKANHTGNGPSINPSLTRGKLAGTHTTVTTMLQVAYGVGSQQITGPAWLDSGRFDLAATSPEGVADTAIQPMLQALLKERFGLKAHLEMKEMPVYNTVVSKDGLKIRPLAPNEPTPPHPAQIPGVSAARNARETMPEIADFLARVTNRPVVDQTGLEGRYYYFIQWSQLGATSGPEQAPDIFGAAQEQLGLRLVPIKASVQIVVIDDINRTPTEN